MNEELSKLASLARLFILADEGHCNALDEAQMTHGWKKVDRRWALKQTAKKALLEEIERLGV